METDTPTLDTVVPEDIKLKGDEAEQTTPENNTPPEETNLPATDTNKETPAPADPKNTDKKPPETPETPEAPESKEKTEISEDDINAFLDKSTNGKVKSKEDITELLKPKEPQKLEFSSDIVEKLNEHVQNGGSEKEFLSLYTMDMDNMDEVDWLHAKFLKDNPNLSHSEADTLFDEEMNEKYKLNQGDDEDELNEKEIEIAGIKLKRDSDIAKKEFTELKEKITKVPENKQAEVEKQKESQKKWASDVDKLYEKETLEIPFNDKEGNPLKDKFNFKIEDKNVIVGRTKELAKFWELFIDKDNKPLTEKLKLVQTFASEPEKFMQSIFEFGLNKGIENIMSSKELSPETSTDKTTLSDLTHEDKVAKGLLEAMEKEGI